MPRSFNPRVLSMRLTMPLRFCSSAPWVALLPALLASGAVHCARADVDAAAVIAVEASGADTANGDASTGPVKTIQRAQALARVKSAAMAAGTLARGPVRVLIGPGDYPLSATLTFTPADSGTTGAPVSYEARQPGTVQISGGVSLGSKTAASAAATVSYAAPPDAAAISGGSQLFVNGRRATLARQPDADAAWFVQGALSAPGEVPGKQGAEAFTATPAHLSWIAGLSAADKKRAIVDVYHSWTTSKHRLSGQPAPGGSVRIAPRALWPFLSQGTSQRFFIENVSGALDAPGEWIYDSSAVRYISRSDEVGKPLQATLPVLEKLVLVRGEPGRPVVGLQFIGLTFTHSRYLMPESGMNDHQAATEVSAAIEVNRATGFVFANSSVQHTGGWGLWLREAVREARVTGSTFSDLGAGGIKVGLGAQAAADTSATGANLIVGNTVSGTGQVFPGAVGIWVGQSWDNQLLRNTVHDTTYSGISVGWSWGYAPASSGRNLVKGNLLYNIGLRQLADLAGIYTLGRAPGTVIANNIIRNVRGYPSYGVGAWGIYNDEGSSGLLIEGNVVLDTDSGGYHLHLGKDNTLKGNIFAGGDAAEIQISNPGADTNLTVQGNLMAPKGAQLFNQFTPVPGIRFEGNEVSLAGSGKTPALSQCGGDCVLGNAALQAGAAPTDIRSANAAWQGVINTAVAAWRGDGSTTASVGEAANAGGEPQRRAVGLAAARSVAAVAESPKALIAPAADLLVDFVGTAAGARPVNLRYAPSGNLGAMQIEAQADAPNGKCLAFNDGPSLANSWEPYAFAELGHTQGRTVVDFELKIDATATMSVEWRDDAKAYLTGPAMRITAAGLQVGGKLLAPVAVGVWTKFRMSADLGDDSGKWSLEMTPADGKKTSFNGLAISSSSWRRFNNLGFSSAGTVVSHACIASIKAVNTSGKASASR